MRQKRLKSNLRRGIEAGVAFAFPSGQHVSRLLWSVDGFLFPQEAAFLSHLAAHSPGEGRVVEIGSLQGLSTLCLVRGLVRRSPKSRVVSIDPHLYESEHQLRGNLERFDATNNVDVHVARSEDALDGWNEPVRVVFIDGAHDLESVMRDFHGWLPHLIPGGFVLLHDSTPLSKFPGPRHVAERSVTPGSTFQSRGTVGSITWGRTCGGAPWNPGFTLATSLDTILLRFKALARGRK